MSEARTLLIDASVFITLADTGSLELLRETAGRLSMPQTVAEEITSQPATSDLDCAVGDWLSSTSLLHGRELEKGWTDRLERAADHLGRGSDPGDWAGDVTLLAAAMYHENPVVVTDDKPLRQTCKALSVPVSGSIGVLVRAVERGDIDPSEAKSKLEAMDEVGARLSASLYRKAERLIEDAADE